jgi:hypothetical protein
MAFVKHDTVVSVNILMSHIWTFCSLNDSSFMLMFFIYANNKTLVDALARWIVMKAGM